MASRVSRRGGQPFRIRPLGTKPTHVMPTRSWWLSLDRSAFQRRAAEELPRMRGSKDGLVRVVETLRDNGMLPVSSVHRRTEAADDEDAA